jgi:hypothetical protein
LEADAGYIQRHRSAGGPPQLRVRHINVLSSRVRSRISGWRASLHPSVGGAAAISVSNPNSLPSARNAIIDVDVTELAGKAGLAPATVPRRFEVENLASNRA